MALAASCRGCRLVGTLLLTEMILAGVAASGAHAAAPPRSAGIADADTRAWWQIAETLSSDAMEGRDIGSAGYDRAAEVVAARFKAVIMALSGRK